MITRSSLEPGAPILCEDDVLERLRAALAGCRPCTSAVQAAVDELVALRAQKQRALRKFKPRAE